MDPVTEEHVTRRFLGDAKEEIGRAGIRKCGVVVGPNRALSAGVQRACSDERRLGRAGGRIYSTVGYADAALA